ncbi:OLC1v1024446C1 [Oldenlandia corymbosa var. corymbosa]|uniref:OLC1v1024446C1 n=1 Tax=Oldenlandia corymbosa var. corymbosa TaxID=529605 RepID=A0AAV1C2R0_OLDCO|nr:OLC1v1024446C1 [Oldenlandia corymbosa var. corymbosa]
MVGDRNVDVPTGTPQSFASLFHKPLESKFVETLFYIATVTRKPFQVDTPTLNLTRLSVARFCVEANLTKELPKSIKIGKRGKKHEQSLTYEYVPSFCSKCKKIGHKKEECRQGKVVQAAQVVRNPRQETKDAKGKGILIKQPPQWKLKPSNTVESKESKGVYVRGNPNSSGLIVAEKTLIPVDAINDSRPAAEVHGNDEMHRVEVPVKENQIEDNVSLAEQKTLQQEDPTTNNKFQTLAEIVMVEDASDCEDEREEPKQPVDEAIQKENVSPEKDPHQERSLTQRSDRIVHYASDEEHGANKSELFEEEEAAGGAGQKGRWRIHSWEI